MYASMRLTSPLRLGRSEHCLKPANKDQRDRRTSSSVGDVDAHGLARLDRGAPRERRRGGLGQALPWLTRSDRLIDLSATYASRVVSIGKSMGQNAAAASIEVVAGRAVMGQRLAGQKPPARHQRWRVRWPQQPRIFQPAKAPPMRRRIAESHRRGAMSAAANVKSGFSDQLRRTPIGGVGCPPPRRMDRRLALIQRRQRCRQVPARSPRGKALRRSHKGPAGARCWSHRGDLASGNIQRAHLAGPGCNQHRPAPSSTR